jgi:Ala-tRNA(Pro) deacylase
MQIRRCHWKGATENWRLGNWSLLKEEAMSIPSSILEFLDSRRIRYRHLTHPQEFAASRVAESQHVSGKELAKSVLVVADDRLVMAVIPANERLDLEKMAHLVGAAGLRLARESEFQDRFPGCEVGAEPPLGQLYGVPLWLDVSFEDHATITFNAGTHTDTIQMSVTDFEELEKPVVGRLTELRSGH